MDTNPPFAESLAKLIHINDKQYHTKKTMKELQFSKAKNIVDTQLLLCGGLPIAHTVYDTLNACFQIKRVLQCSPYDLPLRANTYYSEDSLNELFSAEPLTSAT